MNVRSETGILSVYICPVLSVLLHKRLGDEFVKKFYTVIEKLATPDQGMQIANHGGEILINRRVLI